MREQMINFLQAAIVFLLLTNALSVLAMLYAIWVANALAHDKRDARNPVERKVEALVRRYA